MERLDGKEKENQREIRRVRKIGKLEDKIGKPREEGTELCKDRCREKTSEHLVRVAFDQRTETQKNNATRGNSKVE